MKIRNNGNGNESGQFSWLLFRIFIHLGRTLWVEEDKVTGEDVFYDSEGLKEELEIEEDDSPNNGNNQDHT